MTDVDDALAPRAAWQELLAGAGRSAGDAAEHPRIGAPRRGETAEAQHPIAAVLSCSDSRVPPELIFDQGLGDLFVVRNAGQIASPDAIASLEYAVLALGVPLVVVLSHERCGAVGAAIALGDADAVPLPAHIRALVAAIEPAVDRSRDAGDASADAVGTAHRHDTIAALLRDSELLSDAVAAGTLGIVGADYRLGSGEIVVDVELGAVAA